MAIAEATGQEEWETRTIPATGIAMWQLKQRQSLTLDEKINLSISKIREFYNKLDGKVYVAFSGGKDSTVLLHLVRTVYPHIKGAFADTGLEYPEIKAFVASTPNIDVIRPKMSFIQVLDKFGYPVISKRVARQVWDCRHPTEKNVKTRRLYMEGRRSEDDLFCPYFRLPDKHRKLLTAPFQISDKCCLVMKKMPFHIYERETGCKPYLGLMATEGWARTKSYLKTGCNSFGKKTASRPLSFWTEKDIWDYIRRFNVPYCHIYDDRLVGGTVTKNSDGTEVMTGGQLVKGESRTGCMFCLFGVGQEKGTNRFQRMKITHPQLHEYCMGRLGLRQVMDYLGLPCE